MNLHYLQNTIVPQRKLEILEGKNLATKHPIYVVLDLKENFVTEHQDDYILLTNHKGVKAENGYILTDIDDDETREFRLTDDEVGDYEEVTRFYTDEFVAFFLTSEAAHDYLRTQSHNLTDPYVYVFNAGYRNPQMDKLLGNSEGCR